MTCWFLSLPFSAFLSVEQRCRLTAFLINFIVIIFIFVAIFVVLVVYFWSFYVFVLLFFFRCGCAEARFLSSHVLVWVTSSGTCPPTVGREGWSASSTETHCGQRKSGWTATRSLFIGRIQVVLKFLTAYLLTAYLLKFLTASSQPDFNSDYIYAEFLLN